MEDGGVNYAPAHDAPDEDDEEDYEDQGRESRLLGFMFGNVDHYGDLDADYLDEDAKEHLSALVDKLDSSLTGIDITKSPTATDALEQDYGTKAENAIDYEDIEEQYEGPEVQSVPEESSILADDYLARNISMSSIIHKQPLFDEENYDEDDDGEKENESAEAKLEAQAFLPTDENNLTPIPKIEEPLVDTISEFRSPEDDQTTFDGDEFELQAVSLALLTKWVYNLVSAGVDQTTQVLKDNYGPWMDRERRAAPARGTSEFWQGLRVSLLVQEFDTVPIRVYERKRRKGNKVVHDVDETGPISCPGIADLDK